MQFLSSRSLFLVSYHGHARSQHDTNTLHCLSHRSAAKYCRWARWTWRGHCTEVSRHPELSQLIIPQSTNGWPDRLLQASATYPTGIAWSACKFACYNMCPPPANKTTDDTDQLPQFLSAMWNLLSAYPKATRLEC